MTAKEFFKEWLDNDDKYDGTSYTDCMIEFAKYHVEKALLRASEEGDVTIERTVTLSGSTWNHVVDKNSILNAYPLDLII